MSAPQNPFSADQSVDKPGIFGARWWNSAVVESSATQSRRAALVGCVVAAAGVTVVMAGTCAAIVAAAGGSDEETREEPLKSVELQRDYGWNFGATSETVAFDQRYTKEYARAALAALAEDLAPVRAVHRKYYVPTLFQSPEALPRLTSPDGETARVRPIAEALRPINTPEMERAQAAGAALAELLAEADAPVALVVDLLGAESVAFAAGLVKRFDPIFVFDNWPHPRGVVHAHLPLAAAVYHQPAFREAKAARPREAPPAFVLDRSRLTHYVDSPTSFDNRYLAKLASPADLTSNGIKRVLYVMPDATDTERDDIWGALTEWVAAGVDVRGVAAGSFQPPSGGGPPVFGGTRQRHESFFAHYPWKQPAPPKESLGSHETAAAWRPRPKTAPPTFTGVGVTTVLVAVATGYVVGRSGSWNRASGGWGG